MKNDFIAALVPAYNEENNITPVLEVLKNISVLNQVLVIDDGSKDQTAEVAQKQGFDVLRLEKNGGKGAALEAGLKKIPDADIYIFIDADLVGLEAKHVEDMLSPLRLKNDISMTVGKFTGGRKSTDWAQRLVPQISGQRAMRSELAKALPSLKSEGFGVEVAITRFAKKNGFRAEEVILKNMTQVMKEEKMGISRGFANRLKMYSHIIKSIFKHSS